MAERFTPDQKKLIIDAVNSGTEQKELCELYRCNPRTIRRVIKDAGRVSSYVEWRPEHTETLKDVLADDSMKHSSAELAKLVNDKHGTSYTRGAILGKIHRLGLSGKIAKGRPVTKKKKTYQVGIKHIKFPSIVVSMVDNTDSLEVSLIDLEDGMCKWMTGDTTYCGHATGGPRVSYCGKHHNAGTEPARVQRGIWRSPNQVR